MFLGPSQASQSQFSEDVSSGIVGQEFTPWAPQGLPMGLQGVKHLFSLSFLRGGARNLDFPSVF